MGKGKRPPSLGAKPPCMACERAGCGAYHDECEVYRKWRAEHDKLKDKIKRGRGELPSFSPSDFGEV